MKKYLMSESQVNLVDNGECKDTVRALQRGVWLER